MAPPPGEGAKAGLPMSKPPRLAELDGSPTSDGSVAPTGREKGTYCTGRKGDGDRRGGAPRGDPGGGRSIAVLANGLASVYPPEHEDLARALVQAGGLLSEMPMRQVP